MANFDLMRLLAKPDGGKIILLVLDGLGGLPTQSSDQSALEMAVTPEMDRLAAEGCLGLSHPIGRGITPGSGPAHLALFGYDPINNPVGRGVLSALGVGYDLQADDVAARGNFCTVDQDGLIVDRRAGRISSEASLPLVTKLDGISIPGIKTTVMQVKEYRFMLALSGDGLNGNIADTDPQKIGVKPLPAQALSSEAERTAGLVNQWLAAAGEALADDLPANMATLRGFGQDPNLPKFGEVYKLKAACVAVYPMYRGVARLVGMEVIETGEHASSRDEFSIVAENWDSYDFFFVHIKPTDSRGEDGDLEAKAAVVEEVDKALGVLLDLQPDVLIVTGDHSTPARLRSHSWHPVPTLLWAPASHLQDNAQLFGEREAQKGGLGHFEATDIMPLALAHALRLKKYGA
ncbi:MAG TPA: 2,3-bisphosphoglycerate-independent phosphoglycerate mutase [candidate division Zixibacteria bacterium]|nr:2,3-bisphosphoglycerate-independent phosphoglycerate mutase [candidate division Zixibacteria bacterium]